MKRPGAVNPFISESHAAHLPRSGLAGRGCAGLKECLGPVQECATMDYSKSGGPAQHSKEARFIDKTASGKKNPPGGRSSRDEMLARMKAASEARAAKEEK